MAPVIHSQLITTEDASTNIQSEWTDYAFLKTAIKKKRCTNNTWAVNKNCKNS